MPRVMSCRSAPLMIRPRNAGMVPVKWARTGPEAGMPAAENPDVVKSSMIAPPIAPQSVLSQHDRHRPPCAPLCAGATVTINAFANRVSATPVRICSTQCTSPLERASRFTATHCFALFRRRRRQHVIPELFPQRDFLNLSGSGVRNLVHEHDVVRHPPARDLAAHECQDVLAGRALSLLHHHDQKRPLVPLGMLDADTAASATLGWPIARFS